MQGAKGGFSTGTGIKTSIAAWSCFGFLFHVTKRGHRPSYGFHCRHPWERLFLEAHSH